RVDSQLVLINGQFSTQETLLKLDPQTIESIHVFDANDQDMNQKYGQNAKNGVIDVKLKSVAADSTANSSGSAHVSFTGKTKVANDPAYENVSEMPVYPGGFAGLRKFIRETVRYPLDAQEQGIQGKVFVGFVVEKDGSVGRIKLARGVDPTLDVEALKVVSQMPRWTPGKMDGKNVAVSYTIPISFILQ
ncbi:MAG TPA: energy transducer TonB, partial [Sunxiuqinia sp.]|nr:energy transducer TonB [Sunxiuqinia sp.]